MNEWVSKKIDTVEKVEAEELNFKSKFGPKKETEEERTARRLRELKEGIAND